MTALIKIYGEQHYLSKFLIHDYPNHNLVLVFAMDLKQGNEDPFIKSICKGQNIFTFIQIHKNEIRIYT